MHHFHGEATLPCPHISAKPLSIQRRGSARMLPLTHLPSSKRVRLLGHAAGLAAARLWAVVAGSATMPILHPRVVLYGSVVLGHRVEIHAGAVNRSRRFWLPLPGWPACQGAAVWRRRDRR